MALYPGWVRSDMGEAGAELEVKDSVSMLRRTLASLKPVDKGGFSDRGHDHDHDHVRTPIAWQAVTGSRRLQRGQEDVLCWRTQVWTLGPLLMSARCRCPRRDRSRCR